ncbi:archease [Candidatus Poribacteria bacterium]|nr:archease [Candidatus Poribacteria bacterium]
MKRYEIIDHTADIGITAYGRDLPETFSNAAYAMFDILTEIDGIREIQSNDIKVSADDIQDLLIAWLDELLFIYETEYFLCRRTAIEYIDETSLKAHVFGEKIDPRRHDIKLEIKSVTYHQHKVEKTEDGYQARVIFDL